jgi:hypothetical protein
MHPRERVLGLAEYLRKNNQPYSQKLINEAQRLGITLPMHRPKLDLNKQESKKDGE